MPTKLTINGKPVTVEAPPEMPMLWVLRDLVKLHGTKYGCGIGQCGACMIHLNGKPERSCITTLAQAANGKVVTIEGLSASGAHPVQEAWKEVDVPQCGYCQAGQIMAAAALLSSNARPTDQDIDNAMSGNLCRCGTYLRIREAIHRAAEIKRANASKSPAQTTKSR